MRTLVNTVEPICNTTFNLSHKGKRQQQNNRSKLKPATYRELPFDLKKLVNVHIVTAAKHITNANKNYAKGKFYWNGQDSYWFEVLDIKYDNENDRTMPKHQLEVTIKTQDGEVLTINRPLKDGDFELNFQKGNWDTFKGKLTLEDVTRDYYI